MSFNFSVTEQQRRKKNQKTFPTQNCKKELAPAINQELLRLPRASPGSPPLLSGIFTFQRLVAVRDELVVGADVEDVHQHLGDCKRHRHTEVRESTQRGLEDEGRVSRLSVPSKWEPEDVFRHSCRDRRHTSRPVPRRWRRARHIPEEPDKVPTFLQNSLSCLKAPPPHPHPRHSHLAARRNLGRWGEIRPLVPQSQKKSFGSSNMRLGWN